MANCFPLREAVRIGTPLASYVLSSCLLVRLSFQRDQAERCVIHLKDCLPPWFSISIFTIFAIQRPHFIISQFLVVRVHKQLAGAREVKGSSRVGPLCSPRGHSIVLQWQRDPDGFDSLEFHYYRALSRIVLWRALICAEKWASFCWTGERHLEPVNSLAVSPRHWPASPRAQLQQNGQGNRVPLWPPS